MIRINSIVVLFFLMAGVVNAQESPLPADSKRTDFVSDASYFIARYVPQADRHTALDMSAAGQAFIDSLGDEFKSRGALSLDDQERYEWTNLPAQPNAGGVRLGEMNDSQLTATCDLMATLLSRNGYNKFCQIMIGDDTLLSGGRRQGIGTVDFSVMVFGNPSPNAPWAFQLDGHHLGVNVAIDGEKVSMSPSFVGAQPQTFELVGKKLRPFAGELDDAYDLIALLSDAQRIQAVTNPKRGDLRAGPGKDGIAPEVIGVACSGFDKGQRQALAKLIANWVEALPPEQSSIRMQQLHREIDQMHFSWNGEIAPNSDISYAIQGPSLIIEFACQGMGGRPLEHLHSMYRDPTNEYGRVPR